VKECKYVSFEEEIDVGSYIIGNQEETIMTMVVVVRTIHEWVSFEQLSCKTSETRI
jgi:hypothetical protein